MTEKRKATAALTNMADGLVMFDENLNVVFCNEQYRAMFPLTADLRVPGTPATSILYASIARGEFVNIPTDNVTEWVNTALSRLRSPGTVQFPLFDGRWIESRTNPAPDGTCFVVCSDTEHLNAVDTKLMAIQSSFPHSASRPYKEALYVVKMPQCLFPQTIWPKRRIFCPDVDMLVISKPITRLK